tara:strand:- start:13 stop:150 length:138 start_codon:yes stop_codon:yes gene_type:complete
LCWKREVLYGGIVLMCGLQNRDKNEETHTYKSNHHRGIVLVGGVV